MRPQPKERFLAARGRSPRELRRYQPALVVSLRPTLAEQWSAQALNLCKFSVCFDLDRKGLPIAHSAELKIRFCAKLHLDILESKLSDDGPCLFTGDRSRGSRGLIWNSEGRWAPSRITEPTRLGGHGVSLSRRREVPLARGHVIWLRPRWHFIMRTRPEATEALASLSMGGKREGC
jgi:hypothetical protein